MDGMKWVADTMNAAQARLDVATANLANAHVAGYQPRQFSARCSENGITFSTQTLRHDGSAKPAKDGDASPSTDSAGEMIALIQAQRNFETAQKVAVSIDAVRAKDATDLAKAAG